MGKKNGGQRNENGWAKGEEEKEDWPRLPSLQGTRKNARATEESEGNYAAEANRRRNPQSILPNMAERLIGTGINNERNEGGGFDGFWTQWGHQNRNS